MDRLIASNTVAVGSGDTAPATGTPGQATSGNPATNTPATVFPAYAWNAVQEELIAILVAAGITPDRTNNAQLASAIKRIGQNTVVLADTGAVNAYTATNATPLVAGTWVDGVVQAVKIAHTNTGPSTYAPDGLTAIPIYGLGLQPLQGGELLLNGTAILMRTTIAGVNSGNPICVLMECAGGAQQVAPATQSAHAVQFGQVSGVVGTVRNLSMNVAAASATATLTADEIIVETALGGLRYCLPNFNKTINLATTGAGGMDTGAAPVSGFVAVYAIYNPTTQAAALLATNATSAKAPNVYGGANMPPGYTASALVSVWPTNSSGQFATATQRDRRLSISQATALSTSTQQASLTALSISNFVPPNAISISGVQQIGSSTNAVSTATLYPSGVGGVGNETCIANIPGAGANTIAFRDVFLPAQQSINYTATATAGTMSYALFINGYSF